MSYRDEMDEINPDALAIGCEDERAILDKAIIGYGSQYSKPQLLVYSYAKLIEAFMELFRQDDEERSEEELHEAAIEWVDFNVAQAWHGDGTPIIVYDFMEE